MTGVFIPIMQPVRIYPNCRTMEELKLILTKSGIDDGYILIKLRDCKDENYRDVVTYFEINNDGDLIFNYDWWEGEDVYMFYEVITVKY